MRWAIVGCGLIGQKRAAALRALGHQIVFVNDPALERASNLARATGAEIAHDWYTLTERPDIDAIVVATSHEWLSPIAIAGVDHGKHVLVEKPAGRNLAEVGAIAAAAARSSALVKVGYNHRFHPAIQKAREIVRLWCNW